MDKESGHRDVWGKAAFISASTGLADSYPQGEPPVQQGRAFYTLTARLGGSQHPETAAVGAMGSL